MAREGDKFNNPRLTLKFNPQGLTSYKSRNHECNILKPSFTLSKGQSDRT